MTSLWISYYVDYPDLAGDDGWWTSERDAVVGIQRRYASPPYKVVWQEERGRDGLLSLHGSFEAVEHYSTKHEAEWEIREQEVLGPFSEAEDQTAQ